MREFFRGWKRKVGCVTLFLACVFAAGWVRSLRTVDLITWHVGNKSVNFVSGGERFLLLVGDRNRVSFIGPPPNYKKYDVRVRLRFIPLEFAEVLKSRGKNRFLISSWAASTIHAQLSLDRYSPKDSDIDQRMIPYWSIVIPLTLLSAWLLLSRPRKPELLPKPA